jgi:heme oxygenase
MRHASKDLHDQSDKLVNLKLALILTSKPLYAEAISLFWPIYVELERILEVHKGHPELECLHELLPLLRRAQLFEKDMASLLGDGVAARDLKARRIIVEKGIERFSPPELQSYIVHLRKLSDDDPLLLVPYIYSMYSAILAGGAIIKRMVKTAFSLKTEAGTEMFQMSLEESPFANVAEFRRVFRRKLDEDMKLSESDQARIIQEAPQVFIRNNALVATAQDTDAFREVHDIFLRYMLVLLALGAVLLAVWMYPRQGQ